MADETKGYSVSLLNGSEAAVVRVPLRAPFNRTVRRHVEILKTLADGRKKLEFELQEVESPFDVEAEMRADAIRGWNSERGSAIAAKNLKVEAVVEAPAAPEPPRSSRRQTPALTATE